MEFNLKYYKGKDNYSDGDIEDKILEYIDNFSNDYEQAFEINDSWPVIYHLSNMRKNIISWYPFKKNCSILEIGAGMGAITDELCKHAKKVTCVELSKRRAEAIKKRNPENNVEIIVGNFNDIIFQEKYDYIILNGVFEYSALYIPTDNPYIDFLNKIMKLLNKNGRIILAIENRFGLKYWCGANEDHNSIPYSGINGYVNNEKIKTFSKNDLINLFSSVKLDYKFYYVFPDYKFPKIIYTDESLQKNIFSEYLPYYYDYMNLFINEKKIYRDIYNNHELDFFANSFLVELSTEKIESEVEFVKYNNDYRSKENDLCTYIIENKAYKKPLYDNGSSRIKCIYEISEYLTKKGVNHAKIIYETPELIYSNIIDGTNLANIINKEFKSNNIKKVEEYFDGIYDLILKCCDKKIDNPSTTIFDKYNISISDMQKKSMLFFTKGLLDITPNNIIVKEDKWFLIDQEWIEKNVPIEFIIYRSIMDYCSTITDDYEDIKRKLFNKYNIIEDLFEKLNNRFMISVSRKEKNIFISKYCNNSYLVDNCVPGLKNINFQGNLINTNKVLNREIAIKDENINQLQASVLELQTNNQQMIVENQRVVQNNQRLNMELSSILNSRGYRMLKIIYRIEDILRIHLLYRKIKTAFKLLIKPKLFLQKIGIIKPDNHYSRLVAYNSYYQEDEDYSNNKTDIKVLAFYLPQFHTFKENDKWWGKGFTEWTNAKKSLPRYKNHYQPRLPHEDIGYYDLSKVENIRKQVDLAKKHGIYGFIFYYYWFSGKRLMEKPLDLFLKSKDIDFPFCLCWANENWTKKWDGKDSEVLISQKYGKNDGEQFIIDLKKYVDDKRYIRIDNKPVIMLYNPTMIPDVEKVIEQWRKAAKKMGIGEIYVITRNTHLSNDATIKGTDAEFDFPPLEKGFANSVLSGLKKASIFNYKQIVNELESVYYNHKPNTTFYYCSTMGWDNSSRRKDGYNILHHYSLDDFYRWNRLIIDKTRKNNSIDNRFILVNAWNEWCEGTYLEPDEKYGYANINTLSKAIFDLPFDGVDVINYKPIIKKKLNAKIAIQIHLYHIDLTDEIIDQLNNIPFDFDCFITTNTQEKRDEINSKFLKRSKANQVIIDVSQNRGRDVAPFLVQFSKYYKNYDYICHIHTKKSSSVSYGDSWRKYLYNNLFGSQSNVYQIFDIFEKHKKIGLIFPDIYPVIHDQYGFYGLNLKNCKKQFKKLGIPKNYINEKLVFPAGTMFWARVDAIKPLFDKKYSYNDFYKENGQLDATPAHAIERVLLNLAISRGYYYKKTFNNTIKHKTIDAKRLVLFANVGDDIDKEYLSMLEENSSKIVVISNHKAFKEYECIIKKSNNYFALWKEAIKKYNKDFKKYDEIVLTDNSLMYTFLSENKLYGKNDNNVKTLCMTIENNSDVIYKDFINFSSKIISSKEILDFYIDKEFNTDEEYIIQLTQLLKNKKIFIDIAIEETKYINKYLVSSPIDKNYPFLMLILGSPLLKKSNIEQLDLETKTNLEYFISKTKSSK